MLVQTTVPVCASVKLKVTGEIPKGKVAGVPAIIALFKESIKPAVVVS